MYTFQLVYNNVYVSRHCGMCVSPADFILGYSRDTFFKFLNKIYDLLFFSPNSRLY